MRSAFAGPTVGSSMSCSSLAVLRLSLPARSFAAVVDFLATGGAVDVVDGGELVGGGWTVGVGAALAMCHVPPIDRTIPSTAATGATRDSTRVIDMATLRTERRSDRTLRRPACRGRSSRSWN